MIVNATATSEINDSSDNHKNGYKAIKINFIALYPNKIFKMILAYHLFRSGHILPFFILMPEGNPLGTYF